MKRPPKLCHNKKKNFAYIYIGRKQVYLGKWGSDETKAAYTRFLMEWAKSKTATEARLHPGKISLVEVVCAFIEDFRARPSKSLSDLNTYIFLGKRICSLFPDYAADDFRIRDLETLRDSFQKEGYYRGGRRHEYTRTYLNKLMNRTKSIFSWGISKEMVSAETYARLKFLVPLRRGQTSAPEPEKKHTVSDSDFNAVLNYLIPTYRDIAVILRYTGMRPSELANMRICDIEMTGDLWIYRPSEHKTAYRGNTRSIVIGEKAQNALKRHLENRGEEEYVFTPARVMEEFWTEKRFQRKSKVTPSQTERGNQRKEKRTVGYSEKLNTCLIGKAVKRACKLALTDGKIETPWTPYELRHTAITEARIHFGAEAAQHFAGHSTIHTQEVYDHSAVLSASRVVEKLG